MGVNCGNWKGRCIGLGSRGRRERGDYRVYEWEQFHRQIGQIRGFYTFVRVLHEHASREDRCVNHAVQNLVGDLLRGGSHAMIVAGLQSIDNTEYQPYSGGNQSMRPLNWQEIDKLRDGLVAPRLAINQTEDNEVKYCSYNFDDTNRFSRQPKQIELIHLTDLQYGSKGFLLKRFLAYRDWILSSPYRFVLLGGDLIDAATVLSVGSPHDNTGEPIDQIDEVIELLEPLAKKGRLLGSVGGNHERRTLKTYGDCGRTIAKALSVPYSKGVQLIDLQYGKHQPFRISLWHGGGSARTKGAKAQMLHRFMQSGDSQLYLVGHLHDVVQLWDWRHKRINGKIKLQKVAGVMSSSFLSWWGGYAEVANMAVSDTMMARILLDPNGGFEVTLR